MQIDLIPFLSFVVITTFTPGPNTISSAAMGLNYGFRLTLPYLIGIFSGFILIMTACALTSMTLISLIPDFERIMALAGALYITWLAWHTLRASYSFDEEKQKPLGYFKGVILQILNPKVIIFGITLYSTFFKDMNRHSPLLPLSALFLALISFSAIATWTLFGNFIRKYMNKKGFKRLVNATLSLLLLLTAYRISGLPGLL